MSFEFDNSELEKVNRFTRRAVKAEEVYAFPLVLCDNEIDRDGERFSVAALEKLSGLFAGKTGIFDHDPKGSHQTARIYECEVRRDESRITKCGEEYTYLYAKAYMMRTESNRDLITEIEGGIKKEVSVSCSVGRRVCSVCGSDRLESGCGHVKGRRYDGKVCCDILDEPSDAYEWSFVTPPVRPSKKDKSGDNSTKKGDIVNISIKKLYRDAQLPTRGSSQAAGYDLYACISTPVTIYSHTTSMIGTGLAIAIPENYFGAIFARSGLASKQGLRPANCVGVCDSDYRGEYIVALHNDTDKAQIVNPGERIAQLVIMPYLPVEFTEVEELEETERGHGGFGSTGK